MLVPIIASSSTGNNRMRHVLKPDRCNRRLLANLRE
jgi:hypothetical protein